MIITWKRFSALHSFDAGVLCVGMSSSRLGSFISVRRMLYSGMWRCVDLGLTDVSEERIASVFSVEKSVSAEPA
jgi:hypothetical protein